MIYKSVKIFGSDESVVDVEVLDGIIKSVTPADGDSGIYLVPSLFDFHCHTREPGFEYKEDISTCISAARHGGYSGFLAMPNTKPVCDSAEILKYIYSKRGDFQLCQSAAITKGQKDEELTDMYALAQAGAMAFTDDGCPVENSALMKKALLTAKELKLPVISHCEIRSLFKGAVNEGEVSKKLGVVGIPNSAEDIMIARDILLAGETGSHVHIAHVSTASGIEMIRLAKKYGINVTCETCPHYFTLTEEAVLEKGAMAKMSPPLRSEKDRSEILRAIADGTVDLISTDHAPHSDEDKGAGLDMKEAVTVAAKGIVGLESAFALSYTNLVKSGLISQKKLVELLVINPRRFLSLEVPKIAVGEKADFFEVRLDTPFVFKKEDLHSKSKNTPFDGMTLYGKIKIQKG